MEQAKIRESNFELLRIIAMILIVMGHCAGQSGIMENATDMNRVFIFFAGKGSRIAVNLFLMIGAWFMVDSHFKASRVLKIWGEVWVYTVLITVLISFATPVPLKYILKAPFPILGQNLWYASAYMNFMLLSPFLQKIFLLKKSYIESLLVIEFICICIYSSIRPMMDNFLCGVVWFMYMYIFIGYYKKYRAKNFNVSPVTLLCAGTGIYAAMVISLLVLESVSHPYAAFMTKIINQYLSDYKSIPNFLCSFCIFAAFSRMNIPANKIINKIAFSTFAVYVIHQTPAIIPVIWSNILRVPVWMNAWYMPLALSASVAAIFLVCIIVDNIRVRWIEPLWTHSAVFLKLTDMIDRALPENVNGGADSSFLPKLLS